MERYLRCVTGFSEWDPDERAPERLCGLLRCNIRALQTLKIQPRIGQEITDGKPMDEEESLHEHVVERCQ
jgi:hypothetical protein